jgi:hypothetical protein
VIFVFATLDLRSAVAFYINVYSIFLLLVNCFHVTVGLTVTPPVATVTVLGATACVLCPTLAA